MAQVQQREPVFDQMVLNRYQPGEGICPHVDLLQFEDAVAIVSLGSAAVMTFTHCQDACDEARVLLKPGDVLLLEGDARWCLCMIHSLTPQVPVVGHHVYCLTVFPLGCEWVIGK